MFRLVLGAVVSLALAAPTRGDDVPPHLSAAAAAAAARLPAIQKALADGAGLGPYIRVDGVAAGPERINVTGVFLDTPVPVGKGGAAPDPADQLLDDLTAAVRGAVAGAPGVGDVKRVVFGLRGLTRVEFADQPHVTLQARAVAAGGAADLVALTASRFDAAGRLVLVGRAGKGAGADWLRAEAKTLPEAKGFPWLAGRAIGLDRVEEVEWKLTSAAVQAGLAAAPTPEAVRGAVRVDRVYFGYGTADRVLHLNVTGVWLDRGATAEDVDRAVVAEDVDRAVVAAVRAAWGLPPGAGARQAVRTTALLDPAARVGDPGAAFQAAVAADRGLDGTRVDAGAAFGPTGRLRLTGVRPAFPNPADEDRWRTDLAARLTQVGGPAGRLPAGGLDTTGMTPYPTREALAKLREWAGRGDTPVEEVGVSRLAFDPDGRLRLDGRYVRDADLKRITDRLAELLPRPPVGVGAASSAGVEKVAGGFTDYLRGRVGADPETWAGVVVRRGYFDTADRYTLAGVVDRAGQNDDLAALVRAARADRRWAGYFKTDPAPPALDVFPLARLLNRTRQVSPGHPELDGLRFVRVGYDADGTLVFEVEATGAADLGRAAAHLRGLIAASPDYRRRLPPDPTRMVLRKVEKRSAVGNSDHPAVAGQLLGRSLPDALGDRLDPGVAAGIRGTLDGVVFREPGESAGWYLSACLHQATGETELARRDMHRVLAAESAGPADVRTRRFAYATGIQGLRRHALDTLLKECLRQQADGVPPIAFDPRR